jgi:hypothetical protein
MLKEITITLEVNTIECSSCGTSTTPEVVGIGNKPDGGYQCNGWRYPKGWISILVRFDNRDSIERLFCPPCAKALPSKTISRVLFQGVP